jgi:glutamate synthase domain-containing protein 2
MNLKSYLTPDFLVERDETKCIACQVCVRQCSYDVHEYIPDEDRVVVAQPDKCSGCHRCEKFCPTDAITIRPNPSDYRPNANWSKRYIHNIYKQAETGGVLLTGMGNDLPYRIYWDHMVLNASQVTNPSIDPLREPMELKTFLGRKPDRVDLEVNSQGEVSLKTELTPYLELETPIMFSAMSYGSINLNVCRGLAMAASRYGTYYNTGEGGLHRSLYKYGPNTIAQVASGRFGVSEEYLKVAAALEIKIGQGAKPGIGGHLPGEKVNEAISVTRMIPVGTDALSPAPHHDIYSIEDLRQLIYALKEATGYTKPVGVKIAAVHNSAAIASGMVRAGADFIVLDGLRGGTGASPTMIRDNVGIPIEMALASVDDRLRQEGIRNQASIVVAGGFRCSGDIVKAIALGADAVYIGTAALVAVGCAVCQKCYTGKCPWGIATNDPYLAKRVNPEIAAERLYNLLRAWSLEIKEMLGGMGINAIESLRGNRLHLRGVGLTEAEMEILGILPAGR